MRGIVLAGGNGTRLWPLTAATSKQLLPVYDKPLIYYPISTLMLAGISEILVITRPEDLGQFQRLLGDGSRFGIHIEYKVQQKASGIAEAFLIGEHFIGDDSVCLVLGDNIFYGQGLGEQLQQISANSRATIFGYEVIDPERYGVVEIDKSQNIKSIEEKPVIPKSKFAVPGIYFYPNNVVELTKSLVPSSRGELEITDLNLIYLNKGELDCRILNRGTAWFDTGTIKSLNDASNFLRVLEERQGIKIGVPEEIGIRKGFLSHKDLQDRLSTYPRNEYREYLETFLLTYLQES
jgi:glucose-1-phosphate thymidylyltransferase